jgi:hypothetical protein
MSNYQMQEGQFTLFKNNKKTEASQPDYTGECMQNGKKLRLAAWIKEGKSGKFFSGKMSEPLVKREEVDELPSGDLPF